MWQSRRFKIQAHKTWLLMPVVSLLLGAAACGTAATATAVPASTVAPAATATPRPTVAAASTPVAGPTATVASLATAAPKPTAAAAATPVPTATPAATAAPASAKVNPGKVTIMVGDFGDERFDFVLGTGTPGSRNYGRILHGYLIATNEKTEMIPGIAKQWGVSTNGLTWTFTIRKGVKYHDGSEVTPQDVLWDLQHFFGAQAPEYVTAQSALRVVRLLDKIELTGPDVVTLSTKQPVFDLALGNLAETAPYWYNIMPRRDKLHDLAQEAAYDENPIGAGPMKLAKRIPGQVMKFERFDRFYFQPENGFPEDRRMKFQSLDLFLVPEEATRVAAVRAGEGDIAPASLGAQKQVEAGGGRLVFGPEGVSVEARLAGCFEPQYPCHDKRFRQALDYAIDKNLIRDKLYGGPSVFEVKGWATATPSTFSYTPALDPWPQDVAKARQLLADAGYPGGKGAGKLIVNTFPSTSMPFQVEAAQLAADFWRKELGLDVEVRVGDSASQRRRESAGELNGQVLWQENEARLDNRSHLNSKYGTSDRPDPFHRDAALFRLVQDTLKITDLDKQLEALQKLELRLRDETYQLGIGYVNIPWAVGPRIVTWRPYRLATFVSALHTITLK